MVYDCMSCEIGIDGCQNKLIRQLSQQLSRGLGIAFPEGYLRPTDQSIWVFLEYDLPIRRSFGFGSIQ